MKKAFTLMEVNLAMLIMAGGILSVVGLYSLGFRENSQSREDVAGAGIAEVAISPLLMTISATNLLWSKFRYVQNFPSDAGWGYYLDSEGRVKGNPDGAGVFDQAMNAYAGCAGPGDSPKIANQIGNALGDLECGLVVMHEEDSPVVRIGFRATRTRGQLMSQPLYYAEVRFQGVIDQ